MMYRVEYYSDVREKWVGMFVPCFNSKIDISLRTSNAMDDFMSNLESVNSGEYNKTKAEKCHCYFTSKGYQEFKESIGAWLKILHQSFKVRLVRIEEKKYKKMYKDDYQAVLLDN